MQDMSSQDHLSSGMPSVPGDLILNHESYDADLEQEDISEDKKRELLETLWNIMRLFVECGFNVDVSGRAAMEIFNHAARGDLKDEA